MPLLNKKYIIIHLIFSLVIVIIKIYKIIFIEGFVGSLFLTILKKVGLLLVIYWGGILALSYLRKKLMQQKDS